MCSQITDWIQSIGIDYPIIQAPMAGGATTAELVAAVANAGGLGSLGAGYLSANELAKAMQNIRQLSKRPFSVNLFIPESHQASDAAMQTACEAINQCASTLAVETQPTPAPYSPSFQAQIAVLLKEKAPIVSFTFGLLDDRLIKQFKQNNTILIGTATTVDEAAALTKNGVDAIVIQGEEAGGHRGSFLKSADKSLSPLDTLLAQAKACVSLPLIAAGGIMDGKRIAQLISAGAVAAQLGTAFLCCNESGISPSYRQALFAQTHDTTTLTKAFSGKLARGIDNAFIDCMSKKTHTILDYPIQNKLTSIMRKKAKAVGNTDYMSLWAGQSVHLGRQLDAAALIESLVNEMQR